MSATIHRAHGPPPREGGERPQYTLYRSRRKLLGDRGESEFEGPGGFRRPRRPQRERGPRKWTRGRIVRYVLLAIGGWLALSLLLFLVSAQIERSKVSDAAERSLDKGGWIVSSPNNVLVLGSDARPRGTKERGATVIGEGPSRSDTIMLVRAGGGHNARLSIPRDTVVNIPGHGPDKINAAYAIGGPALAISTVKQYLGIEVNHLVEVNFENFPDFIDALGGVNVETGCVRDEVNGGDRNGGVTIDLKSGKNHLDGRHALALARVRKNSCRPGEDDRDRAKRQQQILNAIKGRLLSPVTFFHLPWVSWTAPKAIRTDMAGPTLLGLFTALSVTSSPPPRVLEPSGYTTVNGGSGLTVSDEEKRSEVRRFLDG